MHKDSKQCRQWSREQKLRRDRGRMKKEGADRNAGDELAHPSVLDKQQIGDVSAAGAQSGTTMCMIPPRREIQKLGHLIALFSVFFWTHMALIVKCDIVHYNKSLVRLQNKAGRCDIPMHLLAAMNTLSLLIRTVILLQGRSKCFRREILRGMRRRAPLKTSA